MRFLVAAAICVTVDANRLKVTKTMGGQFIGDLANEVVKGAVVRQYLRNDGDVQYTGKVVVGEQEIEVVPDTGSFELVFFSDKCEVCGDKKKLYHGKKSKTLEQGPLTAEQNYGSGSTDSLEAYETITVGDLKIQSQMFWEVEDANMPLLQYSSFQGIFGLGPPSSNYIMAKRDARMVSEEVDELAKSGQNVSEFRPIVKQYEAVAKFAKTVPLWLTQLEIQHFSVCFQKPSGSPGVFVYNDDTDLALFSKTVHITGQLYWSVKLDHAQLDESEEGKGDHVILGPGAEGNAKVDMILDTGTSLIACPQWVLDKVVHATERYNRISGGCQDLASLPDLQLIMDGETFRLPPEAYMGEVDANDVPEWALDVMPHLRPMHEELMKRNAELNPDNTEPTSICMPLIMSMGQENMWILGMPFFRQYYTRFALNSDMMTGAQVSFAQPDRDCRVRQESSEIRVADEGRGVPMRIDAKKLLPPHHLRRVAGKIHTAPPPRHL